MSEMSIIFEYVEWQSTQTRVPSVSGVRFKFKSILPKLDLCGLVISRMGKHEDFGSIYRTVNERDIYLASCKLPIYSKPILYKP